MKRPFTPTTSSRTDRGRRERCGRKEEKERKVIRACPFLLLFFGNRVRRKKTERKGRKLRRGKKRGEDRQLVRIAGPLPCRPSKHERRKIRKKEKRGKEKRSLLLRMRYYAAKRKRVGGNEGGGGGGGGNSWKRKEIQGICKASTERPTTSLNDTHAMRGKKKRVSKKEKKGEKRRHLQPFDLVVKGKEGSHEGGIEAGEVKLGEGEGKKKRKKSQARPYFIPTCRMRAALTRIEEKKKNEEKKKERRPKARGGRALSATRAWVLKKPKGKRRPSADRGNGCRGTAEKLPEAGGEKKKRKRKKKKGPGKRRREGTDVLPHPEDSRLLASRRMNELRFEREGRKKKRRSTRCLRPPSFVRLGSD